MKLTTPTDMEPTMESAFDTLSKFEEEVKKEDKGEDYYHLVIVGKQPEKIKHLVEQAYILAGWANAVCKNSSEGGERGGLCSLKLYRTLKTFQDATEG